MRARSLVFELLFILSIIILTIFILYSFKKYTRTKSSLKSSYQLHNVYSPIMTKKEIKEHLGRSTWTLIHTIAAVYPGIPSAEHKKDVINFIYLLSKLYPCGECAQHFQMLLAEYPPKVSNHDEFVQWMCKVHNKVNERLGKSIFDCKTVEDRWECGCDA